MKYFLDTEFIEDGRTIDLISIGIVSEDNRSLYLQNSECEFGRASDWVWRNVFPHLNHFDMRGRRSCNPVIVTGDSGLFRTTITRCDANRMPENPCPWRRRSEIKEEILGFCDQEKYGNPEFWGYYSAYDWVAFCQLFGTMAALPKGYPMFCRDLIHWFKSLENLELPKQGKHEHSALLDAHWNKKVWDLLNGTASGPQKSP